MSILIKFGDTLRRLREKKGMTQEDVAFKSGVSVYYISKLERGKANPSLETIYKIAKALNIGLGQLVSSL